MISAIKLKLSWRLKMLKLSSKYGYSAGQVAHITAQMEFITNVNKRDSVSIKLALTAWGVIYSVLNKRYNSSNQEIFSVCKDALDMQVKLCNFTENYFPEQLLVEIPNGRGSMAKADLLLQRDWDWSYAANGNIIRNSRLYGDRNILPHSANPLEYLKFKCLPNERLVYSTAEDEFINSEYSGIAPVFLGIELETEKTTSTPTRIEHMIVEDLGMDYVILKHDGSLQDGIEIVTAPATIGYHLKAWDKFFNNSAKHLTSWSGERCGMHVHISRAAFTPLHLGKLITFINNTENRDFITTIAGRKSKYGKFFENRLFHVKSKLVSYMEQLNKQLELAKSEKAKENIREKISAATKEASANSSNDIYTLITDIEHGGERFSSINLTKEGTVEIRIFRGNVSRVGMLKNIEFTHAAVEFTRASTFRTSPLDKEAQAERVLKRKENTDYHLHFTYFLDWLANDTSGNYENLKDWLRCHKITDKFTKRKLSDKAPPEKRIADDDIRAVA